MPRRWKWEQSEKIKVSDKSTLERPAQQDSRRGQQTIGGGTTWWLTCASNTDELGRIRSAGKAGWPGTIFVCNYFQGYRYFAASASPGLASASERLNIDVAGTDIALSDESRVQNDLSAHRSEPRRGAPAAAFSGAAAPSPRRKPTSSRRGRSRRPNEDELPGPGHVSHRSFQQTGGPPHAARNHFRRVVEISYVNHVEAGALR